MKPVGQVERVFQDLDAAGVRWCLLRGEEHLSSLEGDLDMLVGEDGAASATSVLQDHGFVAMPRLHRRDPTSFVCLAADGDRWVRLDVTEDISIGGLRFPVAHELLRRVECNDGVRLPHPHDRFWTLLLHSAWDHGHIDQRHRSQLRALVPPAGGDGPVADQLLQWGLTRAELDELRHDVAADSWHELDRRLATIRQRGLGGQRPLARTGRILRRSRSVMRRVVLGLSRPGMSIALLGPDGSGKSSLVDELGRSLPVETRRMYVGLYQRHCAPMPVPGLGFVLRLARLASVGIRAGYHQARGRVVVFDRHPVELAIGLSPRAGSASRLRRWILSRAFPMADVTLVLDAPAELLSARKPEHTPDEARHQREGYRALARKQALAVISTADSVEEARRRIVAAVWPRLAARARRRA